MYEIKKFENLKNLEGFSEKSLKIHLALYEGYVKNTNRILESLEKIKKEGTSDTPEYAELKRRFGWEFDGMRLHEINFGLMGFGGEMEEGSKLHEAIKSSFGTFEDWKKDFIATGKMRGIGWAILYQDPENKKLFNWWVNEHNEGHPAGANVILPMDMFEHAFLLDFGVDKGAYIETFLKNINWKEVEKRLL